MNIALILSTLVLGASTMSSPGDSYQSLSPDLSPPTSGLPLPPLQQNSSAKQYKSNSSAPSAKERDLQRVRERATRMSSANRYQKNQQTNAQIKKQSVIPFAPTDNTAGNQVGQNYQWLPPTASGGSGDSGLGRSSGQPGLGSIPTSPTRPRPGMSQSYSSMRDAETQNRRMAATRNATSAPPQNTAKPFAGYQQPGSGSSPYMNLFRSGNGNGTIDNYTTLVRPELEQRRANQQFGSDIHGLENATRVQGLNIRQLNRDTQTLQGVNATQYFMNYGDYYPGAK
jgi:hypothetical protein